MAGNAFSVSYDAPPDSEDPDSEDVIPASTEPNGESTEIVYNGGEFIPASPDLGGGDFGGDFEF